MTSPSAPRSPLPSRRPRIPDRCPRVRLAFGWWVDDRVGGVVPEVVCVSTSRSTCHSGVSDRGWSRLVAFTSGEPRPVRRLSSVSFCEVSRPFSEHGRLRLQNLFVAVDDSCTFTRPCGGRRRAPALPHALDRRGNADSGPVVGRSSPRRSCVSKRTAGRRLRPYSTSYGAAMGSVTVDTELSHLFLSIECKQLPSNGIQMESSPTMHHRTHQESIHVRTSSRGQGRPRYERVLPA